MKRNIQKLYCLLLLTAFVVFQAGPAQSISYPSKDLFPLPPVLEDAVRFWVRVYAEYDSNEYAIHDTERMGVVYEVVRIDSMDPDNPDQEMNRSQRVLIDRKKEHYRLLLAELASPETDFAGLAGEKKRICDLFGGARDPDVYRRAGSSIRAQRGQRVRFLRGLHLSGRYVGFIRQILAARGVPVEFAVLPHVESSFNYRAYSTAGAAGIWQFTRPTGRLFMRISYEIDERLDPILSTEAAARLLKHNYEELGTWPLAVTAYNHGLAGMKRAKARLRTSDIGEIATRYRSPYFGFASRNFYCEFLAALHVVEHYREYFGEVNFEAPVRFREYELPNYAKIHTLAKHLDLDVQELAEFNPALRKPILSGARYVPRGYLLRVPPRVQSDVLMASVPSSEWMPSQRESNWYCVQKGDTLAKIAKRHRTPVSALVALNDIANSHQIRAGDVIRLPERETLVRRTEGRSEGKPETGDKVDPGPVASAGEAVSNSPPKEGIVFPIVAVAEAAKREESQRAGPPLGAVPGAAISTFGLEVVQNSRPLAGYVRVEPEETLGHYADWLNASVQKIRKWNRLPSKAHIRSGQRIKVVFERVTPEQFNSARLEHHRGIEEDFFNNYQVRGTVPHEFRKGESLWYLCQEVYHLPYWLIMRYNGEVVSRPPKPGDVIQIPQVAASGPASP